MAHRKARRFQVLAMIVQFNVQASALNRFILTIPAIRRLVETRSSWEAMVVVTSDLQSPDWDDDEE